MPNDDIEEDDLGIDIEVFVQEGEVIEVQYKGETVRARVLDYDVVFPVTAHSLKRDADGDYYTETIV